MMRSLYSGVSGLQVHQVKMDTIGNNIANVNTVGFKASKVTFAEVFSQTVKGAGAPQEGRGGTNPQQIGLGAGLSTISVQHTKGSTQRTDNPTDLMIDGNGFFVVSADATGQNKFYTRAGNFTLDKLGYVVNANGFKLLDTLGQAIRINKSENKNATASTLSEMRGNLNFNYDSATDFQPDNSIYTTALDVYDSVGNVSNIDVKFGQKISTIPGAADGLSYRVVSFSSDGATPIGDLTPVVPPALLPVTNVYAEFDAKGNFSRLVNTLTTDAAGYATGATALPVSALVISQSGVEDIDISISDAMFSGMTHYSQTTDLKAISVDGNSAGSLDSFAISSSGEVVGTFTNGERKTLATIGLASFDNSPGLIKIGGNLFTDTPNSGTPKFGEPGTGSFGALTPGALEMSNVDLSQEFTEMITTQRGFQANSRVITTTDEMLQELVNLKR